MICPYCKHADTRVIDSRITPNDHSVKRRRHCSNCQARFTTYEQPQFSMPKVVKKDGRRVPFNDEKLKSGLLRSLEKRPVSVDRFEQMFQNIRLNIMQIGDAEIHSTVIGDVAMQALESLDHIAYIRFASVYWAFDNPNAFTKLIKDLANMKKQPLGTET